jgi:hypothetical protein
MVCDEVELLMPITSSSIMEVAKTISGLDPEAKIMMRERLRICVECPSGAYDKGFCRRKEGGCGCNLWLKTQARSEKCPKGHW